MASHPEIVHREVPQERVVEEAVHLTDPVAGGLRGDLGEPVTTIPELPVIGMQGQSQEHQPLALLEGRRTAAPAALLRLATGSARAGIVPAHPRTKECPTIDLPPDGRGQVGVEVVRLDQASGPFEVTAIELE